MEPKKPKILAISSTGGHWVQLLRLRPAFEGCEIHFATSQAGNITDLDQDADECPTVAGFNVFTDASRDTKFKLLLQLFQLVWIFIRLRPDVVISTGAAPGYFAIRLGKMLGAKTIWVDSIANAEELSLSGRMAKRYADLTLTQWPELASENVRYEGAVL